MKDLTFLESISSIADIGASKKRDYFFLRTFLETFKGPVYGIKPGNPEHVASLPRAEFYPSLADMPAEKKVDFAFIEVPREAVLGVIDDCIKKGVKLASIFTSGFSDSGTIEGRSLQSELVQRIKGTGLHVIGPNCMGLFYPRLGIRWRPSLPMLAGEVGIVAQSGGLCNLLIHGLASEQVGISKAFSIGNASDIGVQDVVDYFSSDRETKQVIAYIEGIPDGTGRELSRTMRAMATSGKHVIIIKGGRTEAGSKAARSHTASLAGNFVTWKAAMAQAGGIVVETFEDALGVTKYISFTGGTKVHNLCMLTLSGGFGVVSADTLVDHGMALPDLRKDPALRGTLESLLKASGTSFSNPVDVAALLYDVQLLESILAAVLASDSIDGVVFEIAPLYLAHQMRKDVDLAREIPEMLERVRATTSKPILVIIEDIGYDQIRRPLKDKLQSQHFPVFDDILPLARALHLVNRTKHQQSIRAGDNSK